MESRCTPSSAARFLCWTLLAWDSQPRWLFHLFLYGLPVYIQQLIFLFYYWWVCGCFQHFTITSNVAAINIHLPDSGCRFAGFSLEYALRNECVGCRECACSALLVSTRVFVEWVCHLKHPLPHRRVPCFRSLATLYGLAGRFLPNQWVFDKKMSNQWEKVCHWNLS